MSKVIFEYNEQEIQEVNNFRAATAVARVSLVQFAKDNNLSLQIVNRIVAEKPKDHFFPKYREAMRKFVEDNAIGG